ncbi:AAA family ATPase [Mucilaginibacter ginsenosidivorans]|uniref:AAA family ATPase n=1 Tax=Mucilaginibacter ginsenosidivorans TaxID=398053 RepID=A0A5B8UQR5_9SPHI|nr:AAA family ATPase [Mucilaginibacter ginsenosidivorans]QEC61232.1 AAA family ATPase [Mucilaginibacter ginsenosidivorans]
MEENPSTHPRPGEAAVSIPTISPKIDLSGLSVPTTIPKGFSEAIRDEMLRDNEEYWAQENVARGLFLIRPVKKWIDEAKNEPVPKMLFSEFWHEGELCILFSDTNLGKSVLAIQIGNSITSGVPIPGFRMEANAQKVLYFDFEMSKKQLEVRYAADYKEHFQFHPDFFRAVIDPDFDLPEDTAGYEEYLAESLESAVVSCNAKVLIIDNLTYLRNETEKAHSALPLMKQLKRLKTKYRLSILALAHTPKRDKSKPITRNDLHGSKMLINFCDSAFAIGENPKDKDVRYLKQIKQRNTGEMYGAENVCVCIVNKPHNFLQYEFTGFGREWDHLREPSPDSADHLLNSVQELHDTGMTQREIAAELAISPSKVNRLLKNGR